MRRVKEDRTFEKVVAAIIGLGVILFAIGWVTREDPAEKPLLIIAGGGFIHNYRVADIFYGFTALVAKPVSSGSLIVAEFDNPSGGPPIIVEKRLNPRTNRYGLRTPSLKKVSQGSPYKVAIRLYDRTRTNLLFAAERTYYSTLDSASLPDKPLTVGPGYHAYPDKRAPCSSQSC